MFAATLSGQQVRIRLLAGKQLKTTVFSVYRGSYEISAYEGQPLLLTEGQSAAFTFINGRIGVKSSGAKGFLCDSVLISGKTGNDIFSLRSNGSDNLKRLYTGTLHCYPDLGFLVLVNHCDVEEYVAGVVKAEGGSGWSIEYFKTQAVLARTYMYRYYDRHLLDRYNLCDGTHCQAFNGITTDPVILRAATGTHGQVVLDRDSILIMSAFHSNCGGETASSADVWVTGQSYLKKVIDPYCITSRNAKWHKRIPKAEWESYLRNNGFRINGVGTSFFNFSQLTRTKDYMVGQFSVPFIKIRSDLNLRSAFFSVTDEGETIIFNGRGYGHGVGLCQEGAMEMASRGFSYSQIISFYYTGVLITDVRYIKKKVGAKYPGNNFFSDLLF